MTSTAPPRISAVVMTHPRRQAHAEALCERHPDLRLRVVVDPDPDGPPSSVRTGRLAWESIDDDATHHLVVEDDVDLCDDVAGQVPAAVAAQPDAAVSLHAACTSRVSFSGRLAAMRSTPWAPVIGAYVPTVAAVLPAAQARGFARFIAEHAVLSDHNDLLLKRYLATTTTRRLVTVPNLSDHLPFPSIEGNVTPDGRRSMCFDRNPRPISWDRPLLDPPVVPYLGPGPHRHAVAFLRRPEAPPVMRAATEVLTEYGMRLDHVAGAFVEASTRLPALGGAIGDISFQLWCTAVLLGLAYRLIDPLEESPADMAALLAEPLVDATLRSWADGVTEKRVPEPRRAAAGRDLRAFLAAGVVLGGRHRPLGDEPARS